ncbi:MAG: SGNH/GDSL hydrolase family protein, partial [Betaproteobacteria bacterium]|nr:SGNH/GDSL hydrolase family protein [Betaproteobacteria bacterium]
MNRLLALSRLLAINLGVMLILLLLAEGALRLAGIARPAFYRYDPVRGFSHRAGAQGWWTQEGRGWVSINRAGFRDGDHSALPIAGVLRVAVLGDSFSEAFQVNQNQTWWQQLQNKVNGTRPCPLTAAYPKGIELLNFGVGAYGTGQELLTWQTNGRQSQPQLVLLAMFLASAVGPHPKIQQLDAFWVGSRQGARTGAVHLVLQLLPPGLVLVHLKGLAEGVPQDCHPQDPIYWLGSVIPVAEASPVDAHPTTALLGPPALGAGPVDPGGQWLGEHQPGWLPRRGSHC